MVLGEQCLNIRNYDGAIAYFNNVPENVWHREQRPLIANAYYHKENYGKVLELLERDDVTKTYPVLQMLANAAIGLKRYPEALNYLEQLRHYGDTVEINHLLASTHLCMGNRKKARACYDHARDLQAQPNRPANKTRDDNHDPTHKKQPSKN